MLAPPKTTGGQDDHNGYGHRRWKSPGGRRVGIPFLVRLFHPVEKVGGPFSSRPPSYQSLDGDRLLSRDTLWPFELVHDLAQVIAGRILHGRKILVGLQFVEPQRLPEREKVPVVDVRR